MTIGLLLTAFSLGLRHGVDWDHIAAIADLTSTTENRKRGFVLSLWYAIGHGAVVFVLGVLAIIFESAIPESLDAWMGRVVGATLLLLGIWVLIDLRRSGDDFRLKSRWMLVFGGTFAGLRKVRARGGRRAIHVDHDHTHDHERTDDGQDALVHDSDPAHDHAHDQVHAAETVDVRDAAPASVGASSGRSSWWKPRTAHSHSHSHRHELALPNSATGDGSSIGVASGIGMLHGVGIESPTQIAIFVASTSAVGQAAGVGLLLAWIIGLIVANAGLAIAAGRGLLRPGQNATVYRALALIVAIASIVMGVLYLRG